jgi:hypothetical protein
VTPPGLVTRAPRFSAADAVRFATELYSLSVAAEPLPRERGRSAPVVAVP